MTTPPAQAVDAPQLRPLSVGDIVDRVFALYRSRPLLLLAVATVPYLILFLVITGLALAFAATFLTVLAPFARLASDPTSTDVSFAGLAAVLGTVLTIVAVIVVAAVVILSAQSAALIIAVSALYLRRPVTAGSLFADETVRTVVQQAANLITNVAWAPVQWGTFAILYYDLRVRHEAYDLQLAAEALPRQV